MIRKWFEKKTITFLLECWLYWILTILPMPNLFRKKVGKLQLLRFGWGHYLDQATWDRFNSHPVSVFLNTRYLKGLCIRGVFDRIWCCPMDGDQTGICEARPQCRPYYLLLISYCEPSSLKRLRCPTTLATGIFCSNYVCLFYILRGC